MRTGPRVGPLIAFGLSLTACDAPERGDIPFVRVSDGELVRDGGLSRGVAWGDFDGDGDPDLVVANTINWPQFLYRNDGTGRFTEIHEIPVTLAVGWTEGAHWVDYDGDGNLDLFLTNNRAEPNSLFHNDGAGGFVRVEAGALTHDRTSSTMSCWADHDNDGDLDVFVVGRDGDNHALYEQRDGDFVALRDRVPALDGGSGRACAWADVDDDGDLDLYVGNAHMRNFFYRNEGDGRFTEVTEGHFVTAEAYTYGVSAADYDDDGDLDLFVANVSERNVLYRNDGRGNFTPVRDTPLATDSGGASKGNAWGDFDNDGDLDLFVANGTYRPDMRNFLYRNGGDGSFTRARVGSVAQDADTSAGAAWADVDNDGDLDLFVANWGSSDQDNVLYRNLTAERGAAAWLVLRLEGRRSNRMGIGAKVRVHASIDGRPRWQTRWLLPATGYASQNEPVVHIGLGDAAQADTVEIHWPAGTFDRHTGVAGNRFLLAIEGETLGVDPRRAVPPPPTR